MVTLRLQRIGKKKEPHFRLIAQDKKKDPWDKSLEILGWINPRTKEKKIKKERVEYWLSVGAQCTDTVHNLLIDEKIIKGDKRKTLSVRKNKEEKHSDKTQISSDDADKKSVNIENTGGEKSAEEKPVENKAEVKNEKEEKVEDKPFEDKK